jgi:hypothetical protein
MQADTSSSTVQRRMRSPTIGKLTVATLAASSTAPRPSAPRDEFPMDKTTPLSKTFSEGGGED